MSTKWECQQKLCLKGSAINMLPFIESPFELGSLDAFAGVQKPWQPAKYHIWVEVPYNSLLLWVFKTIFPEILETLENLRELHLDGTAIKELPSSIQHLRGLRYLNLAFCNNLVSFPETICHLKSLIFLSCSGCSQLNSFPEILENMENLRELSLDRTAIKELPASIEQLGGLQHLHLSNCNNLVNLPESICNLTSLKTLTITSCPELKKLPENLGRLQSLESLHVKDFDSMNCQLPSLSVLLEIFTTNQLRSKGNPHWYLPPIITEIFISHGEPVQ